MNQNPTTDALLDTHRGWAKYAFLRLQLRYLTVSADLYERGYEFLILVRNFPMPFEELSREFEHSIRPMTANIKLTQSVPPGFSRIEITTNVPEERWLVNEPVPVGWMNRLLELVIPQMPRGGIDFLHDQRRYVFRHFGITDDEKSKVELACAKLGIPLPIDFRLEDPTPVHDAPATSYHPPGEVLEIHTLRSLSTKDTRLRALVEHDEDEWRQFASTIGRDQSPMDSSPSPKFQCLFDVRDRSDAQLSELLTLYDVVNVIPSDNMDWLQRHQLTIDDAEELVSMGRLRLVLPNRVEQYPSGLLSAVASVDHSALTLSRTLAIGVVKNGARKNPLLYGPFSTQERLSILNALHQHAPDDNARNLFASYGAILEQQHRAFVMRGANACYGVGIGAHLGALLYKIKGVDARVEFSTMGASIEWAMGLGASYIPRQFGDFDETHNASIFASFVNRTKVVPKQPFGERVHTVVDGLLGLSALRPIDVARNLHTQSLSRFRQVANSLISGTDSTESLPQIVSKVNDDIKSFERRRNRVAPFCINTALLGVVIKPINDLLDAKFYGWGSTFASYIAAIMAYQLAKSSAGTTLEKASEGIFDTVIGLALAPSHDAIVTWRVREELRK
ncbi:hypothetical protein [Burkholderia gladioli]|uniref:hypothetical protein n=1 Tax=Burkholderia gladioli TaxID=28095 RepID=UPI001641C84A|nr:hypothetical protein [Burkholderia gladioli]